VSLSPPVSPGPAGLMEPPLSPGAPVLAPEPPRSIEAEMVRMGLMTPDEVAATMREESETGRPFTELAVERGHVSAEHMAKIAKPVLPPVQRAPVETQPAPPEQRTPIFADTVLPPQSPPAEQVPPLLPLPVEPEPAPAPVLEPPAPAPVLEVAHVPEQTPEPVLVEPEPVVVEPGPVRPEPEPVAVTPEPVVAAEPEPIVEPEPEPIVPDLPAPVAEALPVAEVTPVVAAPVIAPEPLVEPEPVILPQPIDSPVQAIQITAHVFVRLSNGERIAAGSFDSEHNAELCAQELMAAIDTPGSWPRVDGRYVRPDAILSIDLELSGP
jgi:hypothetical protein